VLFCAKIHSLGLRDADQIVLHARGADGLRRHHPGPGEAIFKE